MQIITESYVNKRTAELLENCAKIKDDELREAAELFTRKKIQDLREALQIWTDEDFWFDVIDQLEGDEEFMAKVEKLRNLILV